MSVKLFIAALLLASSALALHEDEVGQRDWNRQHIGIATTAAFQFSQSTKQIYVGSEQGAFGALSATSSDIRWRHVLTPEETVVCWAPHGDVVVAVTSKGTIITALPAQGDLVETRSFAGTIKSSSLKVHACTANGEKGVVALITTDTEGLQAEIVNIKRDDSFLSLGKATLGNAIKKASIDGAANHIYAILKDGQLMHSSATAAAFVPVKGKTIAGCSPLTVDADTGSVLVRPKGSDNAIMINSVGAESPLPRCDTGKKHCKYAFVEGGKVVRVSREDDATVKVSYGSGFDATVAVPGEWAPTILATHLASGKQSSRLYVLVKDCHATLHLIVVTEGSPIGVLQWTRLEGMSSPAFIKIADHEMAGMTATTSDWAGTDHTIFVLGTSGQLYRTFALPSRASETSAFADVASILAKAAGMECIHGKVTYKRMSVDSGSILITAQVGDDAYVVELKAATGAVVATNKFADVSNFLGHMIVGKDNKVHIHEHERDIPTAGTYGVDLRHLADANTIRGVRVNNNDAIEPSWSITFPGKVVAHATAKSHLSVFSTEHLRVFANETSKVSEIRRKYPTANLLVVAHVEMSVLEDDATSVLVVSFIDMVTGSVLATNRHGGAAGPAHILVAEHAVITHFYNVDHHKYLVDVSELFESEDVLPNDASMASPASVVSSFLIKPRTVSSFSMRPPQVASQVLQFPPGPITSIGVTVSFQGVARKLVVFGTAAGNVYAVDLRSFLFGGQKVPGKPDAPAFTFVATPSFSIISHRNSVMQSSIVVVSPTSLESSSHVVVAGLDMMYARVSAGKAWDLLNDDFNKHLLMAICGVLLVATIAARWFASHKRLSLQWA